MLIYLYENIINEDGTRTPGEKIVGEIHCIGDGTPGEIIFFDNCNDLWEINDINNICYNENRPILTEMGKMLIENCFQGILPVITSGSVDSDGIHHISGGFLKTWERKGIEYILEYKIPSVCGSVVGKIIE